MADQHEGDKPPPPPPPLHASPNPRIPVTALRPDDVLFGKGAGYREYIGNVRFLSRIEEQKQAYNSAVKNKDKSRIAKDFLDHIHSLGGRFLKRGESAQPVASVVEDGIWYETDEKTALGKIKQAFRQIRDPHRAQKKPERVDRKRSSRKEVKRSSSSDAVQGSYGTHGASTSVSPAASDQDSAILKGLPSNVPSLLPLISLGGGGCPIVDYSNMLTLSSAVHLKLSSPFGTMPPMNVNKDATSLPSRQAAVGFAGGLIAPDLHRHCLANCVLRSQSPTAPRQTASTGTLSFQEEESCPISFVQEQTTPPSTPPIDEDEAVFLLSALGLSDRPTITDEQLTLEKSSLTDEEQARIHNELFGQGKAIGTHKSKRVRRDFESTETLAYLLRQTRAEIDSIPEGKRQAMLEAQIKCQREEFSDSRLEQFLRADGMNPMMAAQRLVNYWESRRELFGPEKYHLPMTLSEALRDDMIALETGMFSILPQPDMLGRPLLFVEPPRNTGKGYSAESMVRSLWYLMEIMVRDYIGANGSFVWIIQEKVSPVWSYDRYLISHVPYYRKSCWPMKEMPSHSFCSNTFMRRVVKPLLLATMGKAGRCRHTTHDVPKNGMFETMNEFGIEREMLPTSVGGTVDLDKWLPVFIAQRRAIEMEEL